MILVYQFMAKIYPKILPGSPFKQKAVGVDDGSIVTARRVAAVFQLNENTKGFL
jgi:hypothetical protein